MRIWDFKVSIEKWMHLQVRFGERKAKTGHSLRTAGIWYVHSILRWKCMIYPWFFQHSELTNFGYHFFLKNSKNLVSHHATKPDEATRVYTVPYIIDTAPANNIAGLRVHWPVIQTNSQNVRMVNDFKNGISLGTLDSDVPSTYQVDEELEPYFPDRKKTVNWVKD